MSISVSNEADRKIIRVKGRLDFNFRQKFREAYETPDKPERYIVDFTDSDYLDSSALGMLLLMREHVMDKAQIPVELAHCSPKIKSILHVSNFQKLFTVN